MSVIIPVLDRAHCIGASIDSVVAQQGVDLECIVVDDGSTDDTAAVVEARAHADPRVRLLRRSHGGPSTARNAGVDAARGELVLFHDSDDLMTDGALAHQMEARSALGCHGVFGRYEVELIPSVALPSWVQDRPERFDGWSFISLLVDRTTVAEAGGFDETMRLGEDIDLIVRLRARGCAIEPVDHVVIVRRWFGDNLTYEIDDIGSAFGSVIRRHMARQRAR